MGHVGHGGHERAFRLLARLLPRWFREAHEEEMTDLFLSRLRDRRGAGAVGGLWWRTARDVVANAVALRRRGAVGAEHTERGGGMESLLQDVRYAARHLVRAPVFTVGAVAILAVGIGANVAVFTLVDGLLFRAPPWGEPERVVHVYQDSDDGQPSSSSFPATRDMAQSDVFSSVAAITQSSAAWEGPDGPQRVQTEYVTSEYMATLGRSVQRGRWFTSDDDAPGNAPVAVVTAPTWRSRFGADPDVVGRTIRLNGQPVTIVGVGPEGLTGTYTPMVTDFWISISGTLLGGAFQVANLERRSDHWYDVRARLAHGVSVEQAQAAMDALASRLAEEYPEYNRGRGITVFSSASVRMHPDADGDLYLAGGFLSAVVLTVLLLACANLANLLLVRGIGRSGEMAVRSALGAGRVRVARLFLMESLLLAVLGGGVGVGLAGWLLGAIPSLSLPFLDAALEPSIDGRVVTFSLALVAVTGVLFGLAPALRSARADVAVQLREDLKAGSGGRGMGRMRNALVAVQVAASMVLVLGTGLMARSLSELQGVDTGMDADRVAFVRTDWSPSGLDADAARVAWDDILARIETLPGVSSAAATSRLPAQGGGSTTTEVEGYAPVAGTSATELPFAFVTDGYFAALGIPLIAGRAFGPDELPDQEGVSIIVNRAAAETFWPGQDPLGRRMRGQGSERWTRTVVGVVENAPVSSLAEEPRPMFFYSSRQVAATPGFLVVRAEGDPGAVLASVRRELEAGGPTVVVTAQSTLADHLGESLATPRLVAALMSLFSLIAVVLAGLGVYAVVSFGVARRTAELGIRIALGAERSRVVRMVVGEVVGVVGAGVVLGGALTVVAASRFGGALYGVSGADPLALGGAVAVMVGVAWLASWFPARRAAAADPVEALRVS